MIRVFVAAASILMLGGAALAADLAVAPAPTPIYSPVLAAQWTGWYFGLDAGYGWAGYGGQAESSYPKKETIFLSEANPQGGVVGGHVGYDFENGSMVWGFEADAMYAGITGNAYDEDKGDVVQPTLNFLGSLRGRLGVDAGSNLFYGTAGIAMANSDVTMIVDRGKGQDKGSMSFTSGGLVVGAGYEHAFTRNVSLRLEGLYYFFDGTQHKITHLTGESAKSDSVSLDSAGVVRAGLNLRY
jgi:outer membrane immunogenic protein